MLQVFRARPATSFRSAGSIVSTRARHIYCKLRVFLCAQRLSDLRAPCLPRAPRSSIRCAGSTSSPRALQRPSDLRAPCLPRVPFQICRLHVFCARPATSIRSAGSTSSTPALSDLQAPPLPQQCHRKQHYEAMRFGLQKHVAICVGATTVRLLFKAFLCVFQGKS